LFTKEHAQLITTVCAVILIIVLKSANGSETGLVNTAVRQYIEETAASIVSADTHTQMADIRSLMSGQVQSEGQGGSEAYISTLYTTLDGSSVQAVDAVSKDYLDDLKPNKITEYTVQPGDALSFIASDFGVSMDSILWANNLSSPDKIAPGQIIRIPPVTGIIHTVKQGDTISSIAKKYSADAAKILSFNDLNENTSLQLGTDIVVPDGTVSTAKPASIAKGTVKSGFLSSVTSTAKKFAYLPDLGDYFLAPTNGYDWGIVHDRNGVDIANACGTPIYAAADGTADIATSVGWNGGFGKYIKLVHTNGTETLYGHLSKLFIALGQTVTRGQEIGLMGTTGHSTGCHLHFEVHGARNPLAKY
jgi:murein DD-endopeptidase MepM/ murein hydrolase activator NlpD